MLMRLMRIAAAALIAQVCDAAIYVVLQDTVRKNKILSGIDSLSHNTETRIVGAVMNGARSGLSGYGDNYGYGYSGYGYHNHYKTYSRYGYGYGNSDGADSRFSHKKHHSSRKNKQ